MPPSSHTSPSVAVHLSLPRAEALPQSWLLRSFLPWQPPLLPCPSPHLTVSSLSRIHSSYSGGALFSFFLGSTPAIVSSDFATARELLSDRPLKPTARDLLFSHAICFPLVGVSSAHLFSPRNITRQVATLASEASFLVRSIADE